MRGEYKLTPLAVRSVTKPGLYGDGLGLYLQVSNFDTKSWLFRFMRNGVARKMGLGPLHTITLAQARKRAAEARLLLLDGHDPIEARKLARANDYLKAAKAITFEECAERYIASNEASWKSATHRKQWRSTLATYAYPTFGNLPVSLIDTGLVLKALEPIWATKAETASRLRGRIEAILDWATVRDHRSGENPARWRNHLKNALPRRSIAANVKHHDAVPYAEMPLFMADLGNRDGVSARALELTILTAVRTCEAIRAKWVEIDLDQMVWTIPYVRMKSKREHRVPLCGKTMRVFERLPRDGGAYVFPGAKAGKPLSNMAMLEMVRGMRGKGATVHGFRSTFRDWAADQTGHPNIVVEMALAHTIGDKVEAAYRRGELFLKRKSLMTDWAEYCEARDNDFQELTSRSFQ